MKRRQRDLPNPVRLADVRIARAMRGLAGRSRPVDAAAAAIARHAATAEIALLLVLLCGGRRRREAGIRTLLSLAVTVMLVSLVGRIRRRQRPFVAGAERAPLVRHGPGRSFPSRHAACAATMATVALPVSPTVGRLMAGVAIALSASRVYAGLHYPSDVLAGAGLGVAVGATVGRLDRADRRSLVRPAA
jgi:membrane-associated phospholipid phosphatase